MVTTTELEKTTPQRLKMSYEEYLEYATEAEVVEWVDGEVIVYMPPQDRHQDVSRFLSELLDLFIVLFELGIMRYAPFEVKLWPDGPSREPDIMFVSNENLAKLTPLRFEGAPDLVVEIISPRSVTEDRVNKFTQYEQAGVREYWIVDPRPHQQHVDFFVLGEDNAFHPASIDDNGLYHSTVLPNFWLNLEWLEAPRLPNPQLALAEIVISIEDVPAEVKDAYQAIYQLLHDKNQSQQS